MRAELDNLLCTKYPKIFVNRHEVMTKTAMCWGFDHGDGWFDILDALCSRIQHHIDDVNQYSANATQYNQALDIALCGDSSELHHFYSSIVKSSNDRDGWVNKMVAQSIESKEFRKVVEDCHQVVAVQVKEKFGTLRFYYDGGDDYVRGLVSMAEWASANICEMCGERGKIRGTGWVYVACDKHVKE